MTEPSRQEETGAAAALPPDVLRRAQPLLAAGEEIAATVLSDLAADGRFAESWILLTSQRLLVLADTEDGAALRVAFAMPLAQIEEAEVRKYLGSAEMVVQDAAGAHEVGRFSLSSLAEASDLRHILGELIRERQAGEPLEKVPPPPCRPSHRCSKCGRALNRWGEICPHCLDRRRIITRLFSYLLPYRRHAVLGLVLTLAMTILQLMPPYLSKVLVDDVIGPANLALLPTIILVLIATYVGAAVISMFRSYLMQWLGNQVLFNLRVELFGHLQMLSLGYYNKRQTGRIMSRVTGDLSRLQHFIAEGFQEIVVNLATMVMIALILAFMDWRLFLLALAPVPVILAGTIIFGRKMHLMYHRLWRRMAGLSGILADAIPGIRVVKSFAQEDREATRFSDYSADLFDQEMQVVRIWSRFFPFIGLMTGLGSILIFGVGGLMVVRGETSLGILIAFTQYLWRFYMPIQQLGQVNHRLQHCVTSAERVFEILDVDPEPLHARQGTVLRPVQGEVEFRNVRFSYQPGQYALDDVSFTVKAGEMIGLVGPSGSGKSTLVHLIARFYEADEGEIRIDGQAIGDLDLKTYREQLGVVLQEPYLFHGSVSANIAYANPDAPAEEIVAAARAANAHEFIVALPDGYDTIIGERGQTLSGGERQRISIARAVLRNPRILILDEATASVDTETEVLIQNAIEKLVKGRTTFAIAHRLSTLRKADRLIGLEHGKIREIGTHEELLASQGLYHRLCAMQSELSQMKGV
jgi:ATP-binding cassette subfamily B protein